MAAIPAPSALARGASSSGWIISQRDDLLFFVLSVLTSYALLAANTLFGISAVVLFWVWMIIFDGPHVFGTLSRTYFDPVWFKDNRKLALLSLLWIPFGPLLVVAGLSPLFFAFAGLWAYYHVVKQHYGFMVLYKKRNDDLKPLDNTIDKAFLFLAFTYPFVVFTSRITRSGTYGPPMVLPAWLESGLLAATVLSFVIYLGRQLHKAIRGENLNWPKQLLLGAAIPMHFAVFFSSIAPIAVAPALTIYHNIQYQRLVWHHNQRKYVGHRQFGLAEHLSRNFWIYLALGIVFNIIYHVPWKLISGINGFGLWSAFFWGYAFIHYYLDSKIWRVRHDRVLGQSLGLEKGAA